MKNLYLTIISLIGALCVYGQDIDSLQNVIVKPLTEIQRDSLLTNIEKMYTILQMTLFGKIESEDTKYTEHPIFIIL